MKLIKPRYDQNGFSSIPSKILEYLTHGQYDAVILFLIDGFGMRFIEKFQSDPFLSETMKKGTIRNISAQFPSTTTAHITTLHTGLPVGEHGIYEWYYYEPTLDLVIAPLLFSSAGTAQRDTLKEIGVKPRKLFQQNDYYHALNRKGVSTTIYQHREYTPSSFSDILFDGARQIGYKTLPEALVNLNMALVNTPSPAYFVLYYEKIDSISHEYGPESPQSEAEILTFLLTMQSVFMKQVAGSGRRILFIITADHGQVEVDPDTAIYLNQDPRFIGLENFLLKNQKGEPIVPCGSARDFFLHVEENKVEEAVSMLKRGLKERAEVWLARDMINQGYFGPSISKRFLERVGNVVILPYQNESVWWYEKDKYGMRFRGHHGGLTKQEMEIPLLSCEL